jgi:NAD(P)-dependent dehydrogenase (short-subunit alcohol dehydrogenase family)
VVTDRVAFVTGAASGIGRATAHAFLRRGYRVAFADRNADAGARTVTEFGQTGECIFVACDVTDDDSVSNAVARTVDAYGRLDAAFNAAGIDGEHGKRVAEASMENWHRVLAVDLTGTFSCMRHQIPAIIDSGGGSIVNCASTAGVRAAPTVSAYAAAKHGVVGLTRTAAKEYGRDGVRINAICPGTVDTPMFRESMSGFIDTLVKSTPVGRLADPEEIADVAVWLCDEAPGYLTGQIIPVDGGVGA